MNETIQLSVVLQVALFLASTAVIVLVAFMIPLGFQARRQLEQLATTVEDLKIKLEVLVVESRELVQNLNELTTRANHQMKDVDQVVGTVRQWTARADRLVNQVGDVVEPSVIALVRNLNVFRTGATTFIQSLLQRRH